jgi:c-di-GMP-binding flagellar brake protein YcgR
MKKPPSPSSPPHAQRRQHARLDLRMSAEIRTSRSVFTATTRDLSEGGAGLDAERSFEEGEEVALGLFLVLDDVEIDTPPLWVKARVAWIGETDDGHHTAGVRFELITPEQQTWLRHVLGQLGGGAPASA